MQTDSLFQERTYRKFSDRNDKFEYFNVTFIETDLWIAIDKESFSEEIEQYILETIIFYRKLIEEYSKNNPIFLTSFEPVEVDENSPKIVKEMAKAAFKAKSGPMAAVAGAFSQFVAKDVIKNFNVKEIIIENGGDIFFQITKPITISVFAGSSVLSEKVGVKITDNYSPLGVCTSAGTVGHSKSFGKADAVMIACKNTLLADALATMYANEVKTRKDVNIIIEKIKNNSNVLSALVIKDDVLAFCGNFELVFF